MIGVCRVCGKAFETTEEDANDPCCLCVQCHEELKHPRNQVKPDHVYRPQTMSPLWQDELAP